jgi:nitrate/TMAO reductase-like tetraheme cytochrome c subunit
MKLILKLTLLFSLVFLLWSFTSKTNLDFSSGNKEIMSPIQPVADSSKPAISSQLVDSSAINAGKELYGMKCKKCHRLHKPDEYTQDKWENKVLPKMSKKAKLTDDELKSIETYLFAFSEDKVKK